MPTPRQAVETYIRAKDHNRPYLMASTFSADATLEIVANSDVIALPPVAHGLEAITNALVRRFAQTYENVHTFCLASPPSDDAVRFSCPWLVGMSEKESRVVLVGCGRYDWHFQRRQPHRVEALSITIHAMERMSSEHLDSTMNWLSLLSYPWCAPITAIEHAPKLEAFASVHRHLAHLSP